MKQHCGCKALLYLIVLSLLAAMGSFRVFADEATALDAPSDIPWNKIHFYVVPDSSIDSADALMAAVELLHTYSDTVQGGMKIDITVYFEGDFTQTQAWMDIQQERYSAQTAEEVHAFREKLNAASKEYHDGVIAENIPLLDVFDHNSIEPIGYSPAAVVHMDASKLEAKALETLVQNEKIVSISVATPPVVVSAEVENTDVSVAHWIPVCMVTTVIVVAAVLFLLCRKRMQK